MLYASVGLATGGVGGVRAGVPLSGNMGAAYK
jgi:hypothetical protein